MDRSAFILVGRIMCDVMESLFTCSNAWLPAHFLLIGGVSTFHFCSNSRAIRMSWGPQAWSRPL